jgi:hypothetical protein
MYGRTANGAIYRNVNAAFVSISILSVCLESIDSVRQTFPAWLWMLLELTTVLFFTFDYLAMVITAEYNPTWHFSRRQLLLSVTGFCDLISIIPFYLRLLVFPFLTPSFKSLPSVFRVFRILRLSRLLGLERAFDTLDRVVQRATPVLKATGVVALVVWVGMATAMFYAEIWETRDTKGFLGTSDRNPVMKTPDLMVFSSIPDSLYYCGKYVMHGLYFLLVIH